MDQRVMSSLDYQAMERMEKAKKQQMYKDILTYQWNLNKNLRNQAGMTKTEKQMNKPQLKAYKNCDSKNVGLVPGLNSSVQFKYSKATGGYTEGILPSSEMPRSQRGLRLEQNQNSRNLMNENLNKVLNQQSFRNFSEVKNRSKPLVSDYSDGSPFQMKGIDSKEIKNLKSRNSMASVLKNTAGNVMANRSVIY